MLKTKTEKRKKRKKRFKANLRNNYNKRNTPIPMEVLFVPCITLKALGIDTDLIEHHCINGTTFLVIQYEQMNQLIVLVEFTLGTCFDSVYDNVQSSITEKKHKRPIQFKVNMNHYDTLTPSATELDQLSLFILDFKECLENVTRKVDVIN